MKNRTLRQALRILGTNASIALVYPAMKWWVTPGTTIQNLAMGYGYSFIYTMCIGSLMFLFFPRVWPALEHRPAILKWGLRGAAMLAACIVGCLLAGLIILSSNIEPGYAYWVVFAATLKGAAIITIIFGGFTSINEALRSRLEATALELSNKECERERALKLASESRLASLESRIHPHFLFNTINSVSSLIQEDPVQAERLLERMAALLRFSLDSKQIGLVSLQHEMKITSDYLEIEKARFGDRLRYTLDIAPETMNLQVPPLSVQTLVENSVKFAVATRREGGEIRVTARAVQGQLAVEVWDDGPGFRPEELQAGHGLDNLQSRLATLFGSEVQMRFERQESGMTLRMLLPQDAAPAARIA